MPHDQSFPPEKRSEQPCSDPLRQEFRAQLDQGNSPSIESFLARMPADQREPALEGFLCDQWAYQEKRGELIDPLDYETQFRQYDAAVRAAWLNHQARGAPASPAASGPAPAPPQPALSQPTPRPTSTRPASPAEPEPSPKADQPVEPQPPRGPAAQDACPSTEAYEPTPKLPSSTPPQQLGGKFKLQKMLGQGGCGAVYLYQDKLLNRNVAIKFTRWDKAWSDETLRQLAGEARKMASVEGEGIVTVYDSFIEKINDRPVVCIVQQYIEGVNLRQWKKKLAETNKYDVIAQRVAEIAKILDLLHRKGLYHRDVKPENVLIEQKNDKVFLVDFGLALHDVDRMQRQGIAGTQHYMSPEQTRGESHLVDGRTDIWSLGVILYELLTGRKPFVGATPAEIEAAIQFSPPVPPRMREPKIPRELARICLKALSKVIADRYETVADFGDELRSWKTAEPDESPRQPAGTKAIGADKSEQIPAEQSDPEQLVPRQSSAVKTKGLRSYDQNDSDFFLELLPGDRERNGLPTSIDFWKTRIESRKSADAVRIGLVIGPSGCGKSSLMKAGLLPRLDRGIIKIYLEATSDDTELRLLSAIQVGLREQATATHESSESPSDGVTLIDIMKRLNAGTWLEPGQKLLIVIDQFEQWLHAQPNPERSELCLALGQCDGVRLQAILMVRSDFFTPTDEFFNKLNNKLYADKNQQSLKLFDEHHARKVLVLFGQSLKRLPVSESDLTQGQNQFLDEAWGLLSEQGKVVSVKLALFADLMKAREWTPGTLKALGGFTEIGEKFLDECFDPRDAIPQHKELFPAARRVLKTLLPPAGTQIKGHLRSKAELQQVARYQGHDEKFAELLRLLDADLRLITPVVITSKDSSSLDMRGDERSTGRRWWQRQRSAASSTVNEEGQRTGYQLTHDYMVPALRNWLTRKQSETRSGRAELCLEDRSDLWHAKQPKQSRFLPSLSELIRIKTWTSSDDWTEKQKEMMTRAQRYHIMRTTCLLILLALGLFSGLTIRQRIVMAQNQTRAEGLVEALVNAETTKAREIINERLVSEWAWVEPWLQARLGQAVEGSRERLHLALALVKNDAGQADYLNQQMLAAEPEVVMVIRDFLAGHEQPFVSGWWDVLTSQKAEDQNQRLAAAAALARFAPGDPRWGDAASRVASDLVAVNPVFLGSWQEALRPVADHLSPPLATLVNDPQQGEVPRTLARTVLPDYAKDNVDVLVKTMLDADAKTFNTLFPLVEKHPAAASKAFRAVLEKKLEPSWNDPELNPAWSEPDIKAKALIEQAQGIFTERFAFCQDLAWSDFPDVAEALRASGYRPTRVRPWLSNVASTETPVSASASGQEQKSPLRVAAIWTRDNRRWELDINLTQDQLPNPDEPAVKNNLLPIDAAPLPSPDASSETKFVIVWSEPEFEGESRRLVVGLDFSLLKEASVKLVKQGFVALCAIGVWNDAAGKRVYLGIRSNRGAPSEAGTRYAGFERVHQPQWDVAVAPTLTLDDLLAIPLTTLRSQPVSQEISEKRYAAVWRADVTIESKLVTSNASLAAGESIDEPSESFLERVRGLFAQGYRPFAIAVDGVASSDASSNCSLVLHRPLIPDAKKELHAKQQASAAIGLLRFEQLSERTIGVALDTSPNSNFTLLSSLFTDQPDPRMRTDLLHRMVPYGVAPKSLIERLQTESDVSRQRSLIIGVGEFARANLLTDLQKKDAIDDLARRYANDPDAGVHGAAEWSLRQLGAEAKMTEVRTAYSTGDVSGERQWYLTKTGRDLKSSFTLAIIDAREGEFLMGSPVSEEERYGGPTDGDELRHRRKIGRRYALGLHEVTVSQFRMFKSDKTYSEFVSREPNDPINRITWYEAAEFCNWLSEQEGIPRDQWCYPADQKFEDGMTLYPDYLKRTGYRLPTEAEWEYACRAGTQTARFYGESKDYLQQYGWNNINHERASMVGSLKPNSYGLFDMYGNMWEWCHDWATGYDTDGWAMLDLEQAVGGGKVDAAETRILRGGSFNTTASGVRAAYRNNNQPVYRNYLNGFRLARTYP